MQTIVTSPYPVGSATTWLAAMLAERSADDPGSPGRSDSLLLRPTGLPHKLDKFRQDMLRSALRAAGVPETIGQRPRYRLARAVQWSCLPQPVVSHHLPDHEKPRAQHRTSEKLRPASTPTGTRRSGLAMSAPKGDRLGWSE